MASEISKIVISEWADRDIDMGLRSLYVIRCSPIIWTTCSAGTNGYLPMITAGHLDCSGDCDTDVR
jgi:hypothetical protein